MANAHYSPGTDFKTRTEARSPEQLAVAIKEAKAAVEVADAQVRAGTMSVHQRAVVKGKLNNLLRQASTLENPEGTRAARRDI